MTNTMMYSLSAIGVLLVVLAALRLRHVSVQNLILGLMGAISGLLLGALASVPLSHLPGMVGSVLPLATSAALTLLAMAATLSRRRQLLALWPWLRLDENRPTTQPATSVAAAPADKAPRLPQILVDTSVIIDGRIADIATAGFVPGRLVVPRFVLAELQNIADSEDAMRRGRGRRGLEVLQRLRDIAGVEIEVIDDDVSGIKEVDAKLVALGQRFKCSVLTTDFNLNQVAQIQGVRVLNVNELSNAIRPVVLPGEQLTVHVVQPGKERNQGVGYLADGTMIVVENGDKLIGQDVVTEVTRVFQTVAGKMIFAAPRQKLGHTPPAQATTPIVGPSAPNQPILSSVPNSTTAAPATTAKSTPETKAGKNHTGRNRQDRRQNRASGATAEDRLIAAADKAAQPPQANA